MNPQEYRRRYIKFEPGVIFAKSLMLGMAVASPFLIRIHSVEAALFPILIGGFSLGAFLAIKDGRSYARTLTLLVSGTIFASTFLHFAELKIPGYPGLGMMCPPAFFGIIRKEALVVISPEYRAVIRATPEMNPDLPVSPKLLICIMTAGTIGLGLLLTR